MKELLPADHRNIGHGHVFARADGVKARCGGPGLCAECSRDLARHKDGLPRNPEAVSSKERLQRIVRAACAFVDAIDTHEQIDAVSKQALHEWVELADAVITGRSAVETPAECNGKCIGHSSEASTSEWSPDPACPAHGSRVKTPTGQGE